jgi:hypothetical protein
MTEATVTDVTELTKVVGSKLTGAELLKVCQEHQNVEVDELWRAAGYYIDTVDEAGTVVKTRALSEQFYAAYIAATGLSVKPKSTKAGAPKGSRGIAKVATGTCKIAVPGEQAVKAGWASGDKVKFDTEEGKIVITLFKKAEPATATSNGKVQTELDLDEDGDEEGDEEFDLG